MLVTYFMVAVTANTLLFGLPLTARLNLLSLALSVFPVIVLATRNRRVQETATLLNVPLSLYAFAQLSPDTY